MSSNKVMLITGATSGIGKSLAEHFYKKNYNYLYALYQMFGKFMKSLIKLFFYSVTFQKNKKEKYLYRFLGLYNSFLNHPSHFRGKK